jgi:hypothetical protein
MNADPIREAGLEALELLAVDLARAAPRAVDALGAAARSWWAAASGTVDPSLPPAERAAAHFCAARELLEQNGGWQAAMNEALRIVEAAVEGAARGFAGALADKLEGGA